MHLSNILDAIAGTIGTVLGFGYFFQVRKIVLRKRADEISHITFGLILANTIAWLAYGISSANSAIIVANSVALVGSLSVLGVTFHYNNRNK